jgi:PAS domain S-box-containing protein
VYPRLIKDEAEPAPAEAPQSSAPRAGTGAPTGAETAATPEPLLGGALAELELPLYIIGADGRLRYANPAFQALLGPGAALEGGPLASTLPPIAEIYERMRGGAPELRMAQSFVVHGRLRHFLGQHRRMTDASGAVRAVVGFYAEIGEQRRAERRAAQLEERFDDLARSVSDWVWETDANMNLTYASLSIAKVLGQPPQLLNGKHLFGFGGFEDAGLESQPAASLIAARIPFRNRRFVVKQAEGGGPCYVQLSGVPVFDEATGRFVGYRGTGTDVTRAVIAEQERTEGRRALERAHEELKQKSRHLEDALRQARAAAEAKSQFLARMSHELRTPLNAIIGFSEAASLRIFGVVNERYADYFSNILRAGRHLLRLIEDVLDATRIDSGKLRVEPRAMRLREIVEGARGLVELRAAAKGVRIESAAIADDWYLWVDPVRTQQILVNLLDNAIKFTPTNGRIGIDCARRPEAMIDIAVSDSGVGIPADQLDRVFEHFHQIGDDNLQSGQGGLGLGLAISRQLARMMRGDIIVESEVGRGSCFTVRLPTAEYVT